MDERTCPICAQPIPGRADRKACSPACKKELKREYDRARYARRRQETIARARAWHIQNRQRKQAYDAAYRHRLREKILARKRAYGKEHPAPPEMKRMYASARRARKMSNGSFRVTSVDLARLLRRSRNSCASCGSGFTDTNPLEWDHIIPVARGGSHSVGNLWPLCRACNRNKATRTITEWRAGRVIPHRLLL